MTVRIGKRRAASADRDLQYDSNDDPMLNRAAETAVDAALSPEEEEDENLSNDDGCVPTPANVGSTLVTYEYDLSIMPGTNKLKAVAQVDAHLPVRIAQELGIWCDEDEEQPMNRRVLAEGAVGIYKLTAGEPDVVRTDGEVVARRQSSYHIFVLPRKTTSSHPQPLYLLSLLLTFSPMRSQEIWLRLRPRQGIPWCSVRR